MILRGGVFEWLGIPLFLYPFDCVVSCDVMVMFDYELRKHTFLNDVV